jgi:hypothetical protein
MRGRRKINSNLHALVTFLLIYEAAHGVRDTPRRVLDIPDVSVENHCFVSVTKDAMFQVPLHGAGEDDSL